MERTLARTLIEEATKTYQTLKDLIGDKKVNAILTERIRDEDRHSAELTMPKGIFENKYKDILAQE